METVRFLRDLEDEGAFAKGLEVAYLEAFNAVTDIGNRMYRDAVGRSMRLLSADSIDIQDRHKELRHVLFVMSLVIRDCTERRRRLADVAAGLPDVVLDEQGS